MTFDDKIRDLISEVEVPAELEPENIIALINENKSCSKMEIEHREIKAVPSKTLRKNIIMRTVIGAAACAVFAFGMYTVTENKQQNKIIDEPIKYQADSPNSYDELYNMYTGIYFDNFGNGNFEEPQGENDTGNSPLDPNSLTKPSDIDFPDVNGFDTENADAVKFDDENLYCVKGGTLYIVSLETMEVVSTIKNEIKPPIEMYIEDDKLVLISIESNEVEVYDKNQPNEEISTTASGSAYNDTESYNNSIDGENKSTFNSSPVQFETEEYTKNVVLEIYNIEEAEKPLKETTYKQNGEYISSKMVDGVLYTVTSYNNYRFSPLTKDAGLESYVPAYYIGGEKNFVAAENIIVPSNANNTDYTVLSAVNVNGNDEISVKAVLGGSENVYCSDDSLYIVGVGKENNEYYSIITSFSLSQSGMIYKASGSVHGKLINQSLNEYNGLLRLATTAKDDFGNETVSLYVLDKFLTVANSAGGILLQDKVAAVNFEANFVSFFGEDGEKNQMSVDISQKPPKQTLDVYLNGSKYLQSFGAEHLVSLGETPSGLELTVLDAHDGIVESSIDFATELDKIKSPALDDRRAILISLEENLIGVPVASENEFGEKNSYYIFEFNAENGLTEKTVIEYSDLDSENNFERAFIKDDVLYIIGGARVVSVRMSDFKVIETLDILN